jgi:uncharacterized protein (TIGR02453 family)
MDAPARERARFGGFPPAGLRFLRELDRNNDRGWFNDRKEGFRLDVEEPMRALIADISAGCLRERIPLLPNARSPVSRVYRDVRFTPDKRPYKTWISGTLYRDGDPRINGVLYVHVDPRGSLVAAGFYQPGRETLARLRASIVEHPQRFFAAIGGLAERELELDDGDALARMPRGLDVYAHDPIAPYLKLRSLVVIREIPKAMLRRGDLPAFAVQIARDALPLLRWGWSSLL